MPPYRTDSEKERPCAVAALLAAKRLGNGRRLGELLRERNNDPKRLLNDIVSGKIKGISIEAERYQRAYNAALKFLEDPLNFILLKNDENYPRALAEATGSMPHLLFGRGSAKGFAGKSVALVGTRNPSKAKEEFCFRLAKALSSRGVAIVSGGALGIDSSAHRGALSGGGITLVALGTGHNHTYPSENKVLFEEICRMGGATLSELPPETSGTRSTFGARNRIIAGLADVTIVVEGGEKSGAIITAKEAAKLSRPVMAVPAEPGDPRGAGCNLLLSSGALPCADVTAALKLLEEGWNEKERAALPLFTAKKGVEKRVARDETESEEKAPIMPNQLSTLIEELSPEEKKVFSTLSQKPLYVDDISEKTGLPAPHVSSILTLLELKGLAKKLSGMLYVNPYGC